jgi:hypothetical protein
MPKNSHLTGRSHVFLVTEPQSNDDDDDDTLTNARISNVIGTEDGFESNHNVLPLNVVRYEM